MSSGPQEQVQTLPCSTPDCDGLQGPTGYCSYCNGKIVGFFVLELLLPSVVAETPASWFHDSVGGEITMEQAERLKLSVLSACLSAAQDIAPFKFSNIPNRIDAGIALRPMSRAQRVVLAFGLPILVALLALAVRM